MQTASTQATPVPRLRLRASAVPSQSWGKWNVVPRTNGFHVSRESANGARTEALLNDVGRTKIFRRRELADAACTAANSKQAGRITIDGALATTTVACLIAAALSWLGPMFLDGGPTYSSYGYVAPTGSDITAAAERQADVAFCQQLHGPNATALYLPDGQHRCADKHGRRLSPRSGIVLVHEVQR
jgi:hypothetical protein